MGEFGIRISQIAAAVALFNIAGFGQSVEIRPAGAEYMPAPVDSNSPAFWVDGQLHILNSTGMPLLSTGANQFYLADTQVIDVDRYDHVPMWIEGAWLDEDGTLYAFYHHEPGGICPGTYLTVPRIGMVVSKDAGQTFRDLGIVLESGDPADCTTRNGYFAGGHGDFSIIAANGYIYIYYSNYGGSPSTQGIAAARIALRDLDMPVGNVWKFYDGAWEQPGLGGKQTAIIPVTVGWEYTNADAFWGPSLHWNTELQRYVMLLNHACCGPGWPQEGIYLSMSSDLNNPFGWTPPQLLLAEIGYGPGWYPQVLGTGFGETDSIAGSRARLYIQGVSKWELIFQGPPPPPPVPEEPPAAAPPPPADQPPPNPEG